MKEYIERASAIGIIKTGGFWEEEDKEVAITCVEQTPAADVAPVKHGRWNDGICSECGFDAMYYKDVPVQIYANYCPNCGSRMGKEEQS